MHHRQPTENQAGWPTTEVEATVGDSYLPSVINSANWICIEPMRPSDLPEVMGIERASFKSPWSQASFEAEMDKSSAELIVARLASRDGIGPLLGYVCFWLVADEMQITNLAVHIGYRKRGVGRRLMVHSLQKGYKVGARLALLEVRCSNQAACALYEGLGFAVVQVRPNYYPEHREAALVLELNLDPGSGGNNGK